MASCELGSEDISTADPGALGGEWSDDVPRALGRYLLLRRIARGGMGEVYLASTTGIEGAERPVVVKVIRREHAKDPSFFARFLDEARVQAQLQHSGVAQVIDATLDDRTGEPYAVVEYVEGRSLGDMRARAVQSGQTIGWADAVALVTLIAEALAYVHERQDPSGKGLAIVHRDLSPQNVMVSYAGECKIIDFGTARGQNRRCHTVAGVVFAKPGYVAPEVANGDPGDARVDLYALGIMLWELCAGRRFLQGDAAAHMAAVARDELRPPPIAFSLGAPLELDAIVAKLTAFERDSRYRAARLAAADLARLLAVASALPTGERGVRARVAHLMTMLFSGEPGRTRREFARLVTAARDLRSDPAMPRRLHAPLPPEPLPAPAREGDVLSGTRYRLHRELGRGESSIVYEAEHLDLGRRVAIKLISAEHGPSAEVATRFRREARTLSRLSHDGLVGVHDVGEAEGGRLFCVMEMLEGETLEALLARGEGIEVREALRIAERLLEALEVAHGAALVHRDIKPANIFLPRGGGVKLLDFGLARSLDETPLNAAPHGIALFGTPEYMAPEQASSGPVDARADLYALGSVLYEMLAGTLPFTGPSAVALLDAKINGNPPRIAECAPARAVSTAIDDLVMKALARLPSQRFQTATEMRREILMTLDAPSRRANLCRSGMSAIAVLALCGALLVATKGKVLHTNLAQLPWLRDHPTAVTLVTTSSTLMPTALAEPRVAVSATTAMPVTPTPGASVLAQGSLSEGEDGDFVDDSIPGASGEPVESAPTAQAIASAASAPADKLFLRKRAKTKTAPLKSELAKAEPATKPDKPNRRRHKGKVAHVDP